MSADISFGMTDLYPIKTCEKIINLTYNCSGKK